MADANATCPDCQDPADCTCDTCDCANEMHAEPMATKDAEPDAEARTTRPPREGVRAILGGVTSEDGKTLTIRLAPHESWAEIHSASEGHFMERFRRGAYRKTLAENTPKILFNHGKDPQIGEKPIATTDDVGEDSVSPYARGQILDGVPELVVDGLRKGVYGASHRFSTVREDWNPNKDRTKSADNPQGLPERTITEARLFELGPVTWPAYASASVSLRSMTDEFGLAALANDPVHLREIVTYLEPAAPSVDAGAEPHLEERRDTPAVPPIESPPKEKPTLSTPEERAARDREISTELARINSENTGVLPAEVQDHWDALTAEQDKIRADEAAYQTRMARLADVMQSDKPNRPKVERPYDPPIFNPVRSYSQADIYDPEPWLRAGPEKAHGLLRDSALRSIETVSYSDIADKQASQDRVAWLIDHVDSAQDELKKRVLVTNSPLYQRAFRKLLVHGNTNQLTPEEQRGTALAETVTTTGGYMLPLAFDPSIIAIGSHQGAINPYRANCRVVPIVGTDTWNPVTATAVVAARATEAAAVSEQGPTFGRAVNGAYACQRVQAFVTYSIEMGQDRPDLVDEISRLFSEAKDNEEEAQYAVGVGTTVYPLGVMPPYGTSNCYTQMATIGSVTLAAADLYAVEAALPVRWRFGARWVMNRGNIRKIQALETTGGILFQQSQYFPSAGSVDISPVGNTGLKLLGYPLDESPSMPTAGTSHIEIATLFAPQTYIIVDRIGMNIELVPQLWATGMLPVGNRGVFAMWRNHAAPLIADSGRSLYYLT